MMSGRKIAKRTKESFSFISVSEPCNVFIGEERNRQITWRSKPLVFMSYYPPYMGGRKKPGVPTRRFGCWDSEGTCQGYLAEQPRVLSGWCVTAPAICTHNSGPAEATIDPSTFAQDPSANRAVN